MGHVFYQRVETHQFETCELRVAARLYTERGILAEQVKQTNHGGQRGLKLGDLHRHTRGGAYSFRHASGIFLRAPVGDVLQYIKGSLEVAFRVEQRSHIA